METKVELERRYLGCILELVEPIDDAYSPKPVGSRFKVTGVDDARGLHGYWLEPQSGSIAILADVDKFTVVEDGD